MGLVAEQGGQRGVCQRMVWVHLVLEMQPWELLLLGVTRCCSAGLGEIKPSLQISLLGSRWLQAGGGLSDYCQLLGRQDLPWQPYARECHLTEQIHAEEEAGERTAPPPAQL